MYYTPDGINNRNVCKRRFRGAVRRRHHLSTTLRALSPRPLPLESVAQTLAASCWLSVVLRRSSTKGAIAQLRRQPPPQTKRQRSSRRADGAPAKLTKKEKTNANKRLREGILFFFKCTATDRQDPCGEMEALTSTRKADWGTTAS